MHAGIRSISPGQTGCCGILHPAMQINDGGPAKQWPEHVVWAWTDNSKRVAKKHDLQVTDEHFRQASDLESSNEEAAQNAAEPCVSSLPVRQLAKYDAQRGSATSRKHLMDRVGFEPTQACANGFTAHPL
jgi:hypothetical protein